MVVSVSLLDVQARWAYSEIIDSTFAALYKNHPFALLYKNQLDALRVKRQSDLLFADVVPADRYWLAFMCCCIRSNLMILMTGVERFREVSLNKTILADLIVPPMVSDVPRFMPFREYIQTPSSGPQDARSVVPATGDYRPPTDPLTVGRLENNPVLLDGYHRAASFWRSAPENASISAYVPTFLATSQ
jgi:hypothetical protein